MRITTRRRVLSTLGLVAALLALRPEALPAQESAARFDAPVVVGGPQDQFRALVDLDGDGKKDVISLWWTPQTGSSGYGVTLRNWRNDGAGALAVGWTLNFVGVSGSSPAPTAVAPANIDADGLEDFIFCAATGVYWMRSNGGSVVPTTAAGALMNGFVEAVVTADLNADGLDDVITATVNTLFVYLTPPAFPAQAQTATLPLAGTGPKQLAVADVDGNGTPDVVVADKSANSTLTLVPIIGGVPQPGGTVFTLTGVAAPMLAAGDIDGDADRDIVVFGMMPNAVTVVRCVGPGSFVAESPVPGGPATDLYDLDGDGDLDGLCCGSGGGPGPVLENTTLSLFEFCRNDGTGSFEPSFTMPGLGSTHAAGAADLDGDGDLDWVAGRCVYYSRGAATLPPRPSGHGFLAARHIADLDGEGDPDLLVNLTLILANDGQGGFASNNPVIPAPPAGTTWGSYGIPGDFDGDGDLDLLAETWTSAPTHAGDRLLKNLGGGGFVDGGLASPPGLQLGTSGFQPPIQLSPEGSLVGDLDGDGDLDLIVRKPSSPTASVLWFNDGAGHFSGAQGLIGYYVHAIRDVNHDGIADLVAGTNGLVLGFRAGLGGGAFSPTFTIWTTVTGFTTIPAIADLDGDGADEVIIIQDPNANLFRLTSAGTVASIQQLPIATPPPSDPASLNIVRRALALDLNGDPWLDIVYGPVDKARNSVAVLHATGPTTFGTPLIQVMLPTTAADVDGDGDVDALGDWVVRNTRFNTVAHGLRAQFGEPVPGSGGMRIVMGETGPFRVGSSAEVRIRGALGGAPGFFVLGFSPIIPAAFGGLLHVDPQIVVPIDFSGPAGVPGAGSWSLPFTFTPNLAGLTVFHQAGAVDAGSLLGLASSNGLVITVGP